MISVIIPTYRRPVLVKRAVESALAQTYADIEVVVVIDGTDDGTRDVINRLNDRRARVLETGRNAGPANARNVGVSNATGKYIALLDDDDEWTVDRLQTQMALAAEKNLLDQDFLISCRVIARQPTGASHVWPERLYRPGDDISEYLLDRRSPFKRPGMICPGTLLFPRSLALRVSFPDDDMHEDWSWLLLCVVRDRVPLLMCEEALFMYHLDPSAPSLSKRLNWRASLEWGRRYRSHMTGSAFAGLLSTTTAWRAKRHGDWRSFFLIARAMRSEGQAKCRHWLMLASVMLLPADFAEKLRRRSFSNG